MPGIFEQNDEPHEDGSAENHTECVSDESAAAGVDNENPVPPAEVNQTDKINKFLLKTFLERMNNEMLAVNEENGESTESTDEREWLWAGGRNVENLESKFNF